MKKILTLLAVMVAVLASCNKNEIAPSEKGTCANLKLDVTVSYPGEQTKALIKEDWANGDLIKIWYDANTGEAPDLVIEYNGTGWDKATGVSVSSNTPSASGTLKAVYSDKVAVAANGIGYTYDGETISFNISEWIFLTEVQVFVSGIIGDNAAQYTLACDKFTPVAGPGEEYTVTATGISANKGTKGVAVTGISISNADGVAFVFATAEYSQTATDFIFTLTDHTSSSAVVKKYPAINPLPKNNSFIKAIKIAGSKFVTPTSVSSVSEANSFIGTNGDGAKSVDLTGATITSEDVVADNTVHLVLKATSPSNVVSFVLPAIPDGLKDNGCTGWTIECKHGCPTEKVNVEASDGSSITILAPNSHVILTGGSYASINARTGYNTFVVPSGVTISNLKVEQGAVEIHGTVTALTVSPLQGENVLFRSCEGLSQTVFDKIKGTDHNYIDPSYEAVQNNGAWDIVLKPIDIPVTSVSLSGFPEGNTIFAGTSVTLTATVAPADATNKNLIWKSNNNAAAIVDQNGKVTGVAPGSANITVTTVDGCKTATCAITVNATPVTSVTLDKTSASLKAGETVTLTATVNPDNATDKTVTWTTSDATVATVSNGVVIAKKAGTATITAKAGEKTATCAITVTETSLGGNPNNDPWSNGSDSGFNIGDDEL